MKRIGEVHVAVQLEKLKLRSKTYQAMTIYDLEVSLSMVVL